MKEVSYLSTREILILHKYVLDATGGAHGVRDLGLLISLIERPKTVLGGEEQYLDIFTKAAVYFDSLINYHVFVDGNKRTGVISTARFLYTNGYTLTATNREVEEFAIEVATKRPDLTVIETWLKKHSKKIL